MSKTASERLTKAQANEAEKLATLEDAARGFALDEQDAVEKLKAAAKAWTNAYHQRSRCEKHVRDSENGGATR